MMLYKTRTYLLATLLLASSGSALAQTKWNIGGRSNLVSANVNLGNPIDFLIGTSLFHFNGGAELKYRRVLNQKWEAQVGVGYNSADWENSDLKTPVDMYDISENQDYNLKVSGGNGVYSETTWNVGLRYYRSSYGSIAPMGYYYQFGLTGSTGSIQTTDYEGQINGKQVSGVNAVIPTSSIGLLLGYGREFALTDRLFFGFGGDIILGTSSADYANATGDMARDTRFLDAHAQDFSFFITNKNLFICHYSVSYLL